MRPAFYQIERLDQCRDFQGLDTRCISVSN